VNLKQLPVAHKAAAVANEAAAERHAATVLPIIREIKRAGARTLREIAEALNARGCGRRGVGNGTPRQCETFSLGRKCFLASRGGEWQPTISDRPFVTH
jgi:hypothetical protein